MTAVAWLRFHGLGISGEGSQTQSLAQLSLCQHGARALSLQQVSVLESVGHCAVSWAPRYGMAWLLATFGIVRHVYAVLGVLGVSPVLV